MPAGATRAHEQLLQQHLGAKDTFTKPEGGLAFWVVPKKNTDLVKLSHTLLQKGIQIISPQDFSFREPVNGLRLGYASLHDDALEAGMKALAKLL